MSCAPAFVTETPTTINCTAGSISLFLSVQGQVAAYLEMTPDMAIISTNTIFYRAATHKKVSR